MTTKEIAKKAWDLATKESEEKQVAEIKKIVQETLKKLEDVKGRLKELQEEKKILELDIEDLKEGRLDRIEERQEKDPKAKKVSVVLIVKEKEVVREQYNPWFVPYHTVWADSTPLLSNSINCTQSAVLTSTGGPTVYLSATDNGSGYGTINCSVAKNCTAGAYDIGGHIINLR